ncbi:MAG: hypothetical protein MK135_04615 [Polyangiaceae bacterium]|nr:hypothetical protein [Polyangiaceae bacterium]
MGPRITKTKDIALDSLVALAILSTVWLADQRLHFGLSSGLPMLLVAAGAVALQTWHRSSHATEPLQMIAARVTLRMMIGLGVIVALAVMAISILVDDKEIYQPAGFIVLACLIIIGIAFWWMQQIEGVKKSSSTSS